MCCPEFNCKLPIINECSRNGDAIGDWQYLFDIDITGMLFFYESYEVDGVQVVKKSIGDGLTLILPNTLIFDGVTSDERVEGKHRGFLKVVENGDQPSTIIQFNININKKEVYE